MKQYTILPLAAGLLLSLSACDKEQPFGPAHEGDGFLDRTALDLELKNEQRLVRSGSVDVADCRIEIYQSGTETPVRTYRYGDMPEIVTLPVGEYMVRATYGENAVAAWDAPYYKGESSFAIEADKITSDIDPVVCTLSNVRVTIEFDPTLVSHMGSDAKVIVKTGSQGTLDYTIADQDRSGYFAYEPGSSLTATFSGPIDGYEVVETKAYDKVEAGTHYHVTFRLHTLDDTDPGDINIGEGLTVDATVEKMDMTGDITPETPTEKDDMRPEEGSTPTPPGPDDPKVDIEKAIDVSGSSIDLSQVHDADQLAADGTPVVILVRTQKPITGFTCDIISDTLTPDELDGVGLAPHLDLVNPGEYEDALSGLFFNGGPVKVAGETEVPFELTTFMPLLGALGSGNHRFDLVVTTDDGTRTVTLRLVNN